ncbi:MAG: protein translocase subunit SecD [Eubacteriales bacterium]|nr:protein translocase subunit SecD [Eubacteriales bacterium]
MKGNYMAKAVVLLVFIALLAFTALAGIGIPGFNFEIPGADNVRLGTDIQGGIHAILYAVKEDGEPTAEELEAAKVKIGVRLDGKGITDRNLTTDLNNGRIVIEIPWKTGAEFDPQETIKDIGSTSLLTFQEVDKDLTDEKGDYLPTGKIILQGTDIVDSKPEINPETGFAEVGLEMTDDAALRFEEATGRLVGEPIAIFMDDQFISAPIVNTKISTKFASIQMGTRDRELASEQAKELASTIKGGALPFRLEARELNSISPMLGSNILRVTILAGLIAFIFIFLFMIGFYRLPGLISCFTLIGLASLTILIMSWTQLTLTLPGIAGFILSVAMSIDANVLIFERIKEELRTGKSIAAAMETGYKKAFTAIFDSNMTTIIAALILWYFGTGAIRGFAYTLTIGVLLSFISAITATRILLKAIIGIEAARKNWLFGVNRRVLS